MFVDAKERQQRDGRALMNLHNNRAGRRVGTNNKHDNIFFNIIKVISAQYYIVSLEEYKLLEK